MNPYQLRAPSIPLVVHDPFFSYWLPGDKITDGMPVHWTGVPSRWSGAIRIDGGFRKILSRTVPAPAMRQRSCTVWPTRTVVELEELGIILTVEFLTPALPHRLNVLSRPVTYVTFRAESCDGAAHEVELALAFGGCASVDRIYDKVTWGRSEHPDYKLIYFTAADPHMLETCGDDQRIDWGSFYIGVPKPEPCMFRIGNGIGDIRTFIATGKFPGGADRTDRPRQAFRNGDLPAACIVARLDCSPGASAEFHHILAYDDIASLEYNHRRLCGYWRRFDPDFNAMLSRAAAEREQLAAECRAYDEEFCADAAGVGGEKYASLCALSFRQAIGAHKLVADTDGTPLFFSKENFSNGCIATVDVTYPSAPLFLLTNPELLRGMLIPILDYAASDAWPFDFAPHDIGTYPLANGQVYGGGAESSFNQMPVEECGNMLLLSAMLDKYSGRDWCVDKYLDTVLKRWADYLLEFGYDPEDQLCTDDFAGRLAHNVNLSIKAILALGSYARLLSVRGRDPEAAPYRTAAEKWALEWAAARENGRSRLTFDGAGTWSQKYNLVWDRLLGLGIFPEEIAVSEVAWYRTRLEKYGLPLDSRRSYTKLDWTVWCAALTGRRDDFDALMEPLYRWVEETTDRVPLGDWYETVAPRSIRFQARSVVGGVFIAMLADTELCAKYCAKLS